MDKCRQGLMGERQGTMMKKETRDTGKKETRDKTRTRRMVK